MRLHFQERPWDLYFVVGYVLVTSAVLLALQVGNLGAILLVLFAPGYVLVAALFPRNTDLGWIERIALSAGLSIAVTPLLGLLLNFTPFGIRFGPIIATLGTFSVLVGLAAYGRRLRLPVETRLSATLEIAKPAWDEYPLVDKALTVGLAASIVAAAGTLAYIIAVPRPGEAFTEFFILGPGGRAEDYPTRLNVSEDGAVFIGVVNHEFAAAAYTVEIDLVGVVIDNSTGTNTTREVNRTYLSWFNVTLPHEGNWTQPYTFRIDASGVWKVEFLLYRDGDLATTYRNLHLFVRVGGA